MWSLSRQKENEVKNYPIVSCNSHKSSGRFSDHLRCIARENEERPKQDHLHSYIFYLLIILVGLMITSPMPAAFAESGESEGVLVVEMMIVAVVEMMIVAVVETKTIMKWMRRTNRLT